MRATNLPVGSTVLGVAYLLHLNGPPGIGESTIARRYADEHPGVLNIDIDIDIDIDVLRTLIGGWSNDFLKAGSIIRPAALGMIEGYTWPAAKMLCSLNF